MSEHLIAFKKAGDDLLSCAAFLAEDIKSSEGHAEAMKAIVPLYLSKGEVDLAAEFANTVDDPFTRDKILLLVAEKCSELDDDEYALQLVEAIEDYGLQSQARERIALQKTVKGDFEKALEIADCMDHPDRIFSNIAVHHFANGDQEKSFSVLEKIELPIAKASALQQMALAKLAADDTESAVELLEKAVLTAHEIEHNEEKISALCEIGNLFTEAKRNDRAIETFDAARGLAEKLDNMHRDYLLAAISLGFLHAGSLDLADRTLDLVTDKTQMASCLLGFSRELWKKDEKEEALEALEEAYAILKSQRDIETRDSRAKFGLFTSIAVQFAGFEKAERAIEIAQEIADENEQMSALAQIAQVLTIRKDDELARQAIRAIDEDAHRLFALIGLSDAKDKIGERPDAIVILKEAAALAETVPQLASRSAAYIEIAKRFHEYGESAEAWENSHLSLETISEIKDESSRSVGLANLSELYEQANFDLTDAEKEILQGMMSKAEW